MRHAVRALLVVTALAPFACGLDPGGVYNGGDTGGGSLGTSGSLGSPTPSDAGEGGTAGQGRVRGDALDEVCDTFTNACSPGKKCALYGAIDPGYSYLACGPTDLCSIVTCPALQRCVVGSASPPTLSCQ